MTNQCTPFDLTYDYGSNFSVTSLISVAARALWVPPLAAPMLHSSSVQCQQTVRMTSMMLCMTSMLLTVDELRVKYTLCRVFPLNSMPQPILSLTLHLCPGILVVLSSPQ